MKNPLRRAVRKVTNLARAKGIRDRRKGEPDRRKKNTEILVEMKGMWLLGKTDLGKTKEGSLGVRQTAGRDAIIRKGRVHRGYVASVYEGSGTRRKSKKSRY